MAIDKSVRLTNYARDLIRKALMDKRFKKEEAELKKEKQAFALVVYRACFPRWRLISRLPKGWMQERSSFTARFQGQRHRYETVHPVRLPYDGQESSLPQELWAPARELLRKEEAFDAKTSSADQQARTVLNSVSTVKRLLEVWPEVKPFLPKELEQPVTALAIPMATLNSVFGLGGK